MLGKNRQEVQIKSVKLIGDYKCYDLEVDSENHLYCLANGLVTSNSHSTAYGYISYQTAYLKTYYATEFMCALLTSAANKNDDKLQEVKKALLAEHTNKTTKKCRLTILPPSINKSRKTYFPEKDLVIISPLFAIKGVGQKVSDEIINKRDGVKEFVSINNFLQVVNKDRTIVSNKVAEMFVEEGVFDEFGDKELVRQEIKKYKHEKIMVAKGSKKIDNISMELFPETDPLF